MDKPKQLSYADLMKMREGDQAIDTYFFPGTDIKILVRVLNQGTIIRAESRGTAQAREILSDINDKTGDDKESPNHMLLTQCIASEYLYEAIYIYNDDEKLNEKFFDSPSDIENLTVDERNLLLDFYTETQENYSPVHKIKTDEDFEVLIEEVKKKSVAGMSLSSYILRKLLLYLIKNSQKSQKGNGTGTMQSKNEKTKSSTKTKGGIKMTNQKPM